MNLKLKHLAAVAALAVSAPSFAAISTDAWNNSSGAFLGTGDGELFFVAYDAGRSETFIVDLNLTANSFINSNSNFSVSDAGLQSWIAGSSNPDSILWNIGGISNTSTTFGALTTMGSPGAGASIDGDEIPLGTALVIGLNNAEGFVQGVNATIGSGNSTIGTGNGTWLAGVWGTRFGGAWTFDNNATGFATEMLMAFIYGDPADFEGPTLSQTFAGLWGVNAATGTISYSLATAPVPVPAAVWLLGSGLLGLMGISRRRS